MKKCASILIILFCFIASVKASEVDTVVVERGDRHIFGLMNRLPAENGKPKPLVILAHGFNGSLNFGKNYFDVLASAGYQCYTFDFPCGSTRSRSDNNTVNMSILDEAADLEAVIDYFSSREDVDRSGIVVIGESQGGLVSSLVASYSPEKISKLVLVYPAFCIPDHHNSRFPDVESIPEVSEVWKVPLGRRFFAELMDMDPYADIANYKKPVLIIHGDKDQIVPLSYSQRAVTTYPDADLKIIEGAGHGFKPAEFEQSSGYIKEFLSRPEK